MQKEWKILIGLVVVICLFVILSPRPKARLDNMSVRQIILDDLSTKYPNASIGILELSEMQNKDNGTYYRIKAKVVLDPNGPCPERMHVYYNYPKQNFVPQPPEHITTGCTVCKSADNVCVLLYPEEAVIASHTMPGTSVVSGFIKRHRNAITHVVKSIKHNDTEIWSVTWTSGNSSIVVDMYKNGTVQNIAESTD